MNVSPIKEISKNKTLLNSSKLSNSAPLGNITKLQSKKSQKNGYNAVIARVERFSLQNISCDILAKKKRVHNCLKLRISKEKGVTVFYNKKRQKAQYGNLQTCGSVWDCPICASRITEGRRQELKKAMDTWKEQGKSVYLVTFTNRHHFGDNLKDLLDGQKKAFVKFWQQRKVKETLKLLGYRGRITATEVTHGSNGWHPHYHMLFFFDGDINQSALQSFLAVEWQKSCVKVKLKKPTLKNGVDVRNGSYASKYVAKFGIDDKDGLLGKWGLDYEMTKGHVKKGRDEGLTPFDFLRLANEDKKYKRLFREYSDAFYRKQQLVWSKGLKALLGVETKSDDDLASETDKEAVQVDEIALQVWVLIKKAKKRAEYLHAVELDYLDGGSRVYDLAMRLADEYITRVLDTS